jgi:hypothetical protein
MADRMRDRTVRSESQRQRDGELCVHESGVRETETDAWQLGNGQRDGIYDVWDACAERRETGTWDGERLFLRPRSVNGFHDLCDDFSP